MVEVIPGQVIIEPANSRQMPQSQPIQALANLDPVLDDAQVREAIMKAEANNQDPQTVKLDELGAVPATQQAPAPVEVPQKFLKPDGEPDVDKIAASTRQLDEAIANKEAAVNKIVEDYMREYKERENRFRNMPNPERLAAQLPQEPVAPVQQQNPQDYEAIIRQDYQNDPLGTTTRLLQAMLDQKFKPIEERERVDSVRTNIQELAAKDPRVLREDVFNAIKSKIANDPDIASRKNPHKAAWLEVKEELRLGEISPAQAQPSRTAPVLGGGSPPSAPSSSAGLPSHPNALNSIDLRDKKQEAMGDELIRQLLARG